MKYLIYIFLFILTLTKVPEKPIIINDVDYPIGEVTALMYAKQMPAATITHPMGKGYGSKFHIPSSAPKYVVTNQTEYRNALTNHTTNRHIIIATGTPINTGSDIFGAKGNVWIHGETAPGTGATLYSTTGGTSWRDTGNVIITNVRYRGSGGAVSMFEFFSNGASDMTNVMIDKCSFNWATGSSANDEMGVCFGDQNQGNGDNIQFHEGTVQRSIFAESTRSWLLYNGPYHITGWQNFYHDGGFRTPLHNYPFNEGRFELQFEVVNQIINNMDSAISVGLGSKVSVVGNKLSNNGVSLTNEGFIRGESFGGCDNSSGTPNDCTTSTESHVYYTDLDIGAESAVDGFDLATYVEATPYVPLTIDAADILPVANIDDMLPNIGASPRDSYDTTYINYYLNDNTNRGVTSGTLNTGLYTAGTMPTDSDDDFMADAWETEHGVDDPEGFKTNWVIDGVAWVNHPTNPWTNLEVYWADLNGDWAALNAETVVVTPPTTSSSITKKKKYIVWW
jgi:hypothetical protein